jgi:hypothetical protein
MLNALKQSESLFSRYYLNEDFNDVRFDFSLIDDIVIGSPFRLVHLRSIYSSFTNRIVFSFIILTLEFF